MGEARGWLPGVTFNRAVRVESRPGRLSSEAGALALREVLERSGVAGGLARELCDPRSPEKVTHPLFELVATAVLLIALGWRDEDDADALKDDAVLRLAVSERRGVAPLVMREDRSPHNPPEPDGLASQPTLSRLMRTLSTEVNRGALRRALLELAAQSVELGRPEPVTLDVDSLPVEVHGHQDGSAHNGHYHARIFHPLVAALGETGELVDVQLREGNVHTAEGGLDFIGCLADDLEARLRRPVTVRVDAGFPEEKLLASFEDRAVPRAYVARVRTNRVLDRLARPHLRRPPGRPPKEPRTWFHELTYRAQSWSRERRVVLVVQERPDELYLHHFFLITNWTAEQMRADALLELYRQRALAESHFGELMSVVKPALSSASRPKSHYGGRAPLRRYPGGDAFEINEARLLLNALAYAVMHLARRMLQLATRQGFSLRRLRERVLRVAARVTIHARRAVVSIDSAAARLWQLLFRRLARWRPV